MLDPNCEECDQQRTRAEAAEALLLDVCREIGDDVTVDDLPGTVGGAMRSARIAVADVAMWRERAHGAEAELRQVHASMPPLSQDSDGWSQRTILAVVIAGAMCLGAAVTLAAVRS